MKHKFVWGLLAILLFCISAFSQETKFYRETVIESGDVPAIVLQAFTSAYPQARVRRQARVEMDGVLGYKIESVEGSARRDVTYDEQGVQLKTEDILKVADLPVEIQRQILEKYPRGTISFAERVSEKNEMRYEVNVKHDEKLSRLKFDRSGAFTSSNEVKVTMVMRRLSQ
jgi:hypothetical protein